MTRRERHISIIEMCGVEYVREWILPRLASRRGLAIYTDEAIEELAAMTVSDRRYHREIRKRNIDALAKAEACK